VSARSISATGCPVSIAVELATARMMRAPSGSALAFCRSRWSSGSGLGIGRSTSQRHSCSTVTRQCPPHAPNPLPHLRAPARHHRETHAHEPLLTTPDAHGAPGPQICRATASPAPAQDMARRILGEDVTQIDYYTERVKRMVGKLHLQRHQPLRAGHLRPGGRRSRRLLRSSRAERRRARPAAGAVPPTP
jgi:hypothetical protein